MKSDIFWGMQRSTSQILFSASIADVAQRRIIGTAMGLFYICIGVTSLLAGFIAGKFIDSDNHNVIGAFKYGVVAAAIALLVLILMDKPLRGYATQTTPISAPNCHSNVTNVHNH